MYIELSSFVITEVEVMYFPNCLLENIVFGHRF